MYRKISSVTLILALIAVAVIVPAIPAVDASTIRPLIFPFLGGGNYWNDFGVPRDGGARSHEGNDIFPKTGGKHTPVLAVANGTINWIAYPERAWGMSISLKADDGYEYWYLHLNNDRPSTDDGSALPWFAYAPDISPGTRVRAGQIIGYNGDSGNAESVASLIHFEMRSPSRQLLNPYDSILASQIINTPLSAARQDNEIIPYRDLTLGANIAVGQLDKDSGIELVTAPLAGGGPHIRMFDHDGKSPIGGFFAYQEDYPGGTDVALGDLDGDGIDEIITGAGPGGTAHVRTFTADGKPYGLEFLAYPKTFTGGVRVSAADLDGDGIDEIITGAGPTDTPLVRVFDAKGSMKQEWLAYNPSFRGGIDVSGTDGSRARVGNIVTAPGPGGGPHVKIFGMSGSLQQEFMAYDSAFTGGVRVSARGTILGQYGRVLASHNRITCVEEVRTDAYGKIITVRECRDGTEKDSPTPKKPTPSSGALEIFTVPASGGGGNIRRFDYAGRLVRQDTMFDNWWIGGFDVAADINSVFVSSTSGPEEAVRRRTSVRPASGKIRR